MVQRLRVVVFLALGACVPTSYAYTPTATRGFPSRAAGCSFEVSTTEPTQAYEEVGTLKHYNGSVPKSLEDFKNAVSKQVCELGGDFVVVRGDGNGGYPDGTILHFNQLPKPVIGN
jgi:fermentation-respiration switch protein FrsA (DUF1100 family)